MTNNINCAQCDSEFEGKNYNSRYCSKSCRAKFNNFRVREHRQRARDNQVFSSSPQSCVGCSSEFMPNNYRQVYCTKTCRIENQHSNKKAYLRERTLRLAGTTTKEFNALVESQKSHCSICNIMVYLVADHNHQNGKFRGAICSNCNMALGLMADDPNRLIAAAAYLIRHDESSQGSDSFDALTKKEN